MNISPDYQRDVVWSESRMIHLVDSLMNNYYVPPLIFKVTIGVPEHTTERRAWRVCIDGKQRLTTIRKFFDGEIPYIDKQKRKWYYRDVEGSRGRRRILSEDQKEFIENVCIVNIEFEKLSDEAEEDMFQRVQLGVPLTSAEKLAALSGTLPAFINDIRKMYNTIAPLMGTKRSNDFKLVTELVYLICCRLEEHEDLKLAVTHSALRKFLEDKAPERILNPSFRAQVRRVFSTY